MFVDTYMFFNEWFIYYINLSFDCEFVSFKNLDNLSGCHLVFPDHAGASTLAERMPFSRLSKDWRGPGRCSGPNYFYR
jgi:hypothetical protein